MSGPAYARIYLRKCVAKTLQFSETPKQFCATVALKNTDFWTQSIYLIHVELAQKITLDRNEIWARDLYHSTALSEAAKSLALLNIIGHG